MRAEGLFLAVAAALMVGAIGSSAAAELKTAQQIMACVDASPKVGDARSELTMTLTDASGGQRIRKMLMMTKLESNGIDNMRVIRFLSPADIKGTVTLMIEKTGADDDMWIYLPAL